MEVLQEEAESDEDDRSSEKSNKCGIRLQTLADPKNALKTKSLVEVMTDKEVGQLVYFHYKS